MLPTVKPATVSGRTVRGVAMSLEHWSLAFFIAVAVITGATALRTSLGGLFATLGTITGGH